MPTYHYRCRDCANEFEQFQSIMDDSLTDCPECDGTIFRIISGGSGVIFKGSGFYQTDYRKSSYKSDAAKDKQSPVESSKPKDKSTSKAKPKDK